MKDFTDVRRYTFYQEYGNGVQEDEPDGDSVDYDTYVRKLSDVCPRFDVVWKGGE